MARVGMKSKRRMGAACFGAVALCLASCAHDLKPVADPGNLALNKPALCSSMENDEHNAAAANDGDPYSCWCADDEPEAGPEWWQVDLQRRADLSECRIRWPYAGHHYRYRIDGSADGKVWTLLSDQGRNAVTAQVHRVALSHANGMRHVRITVIGFDEGCWASLSEVSIFGVEQTIGAR